MGVYQLKSSQLKTDVLKDDTALTGNAAIVATFDVPAHPIEAIDTQSTILNALDAQATLLEILDAPGAIVETLDTPALIVQTIDRPVEPKSLASG